MPDDISTYYESRLQREIEAIDGKIRDLTAEKKALERQLMKARREASSFADVNRKNSVSRIMIENRIIEALKKSSKPLTSKDLKYEAMYVEFSLKEATFRTHLHRMKTKGLIEPAGRKGLWRLPAVNHDGTP